MPAAPAATSSSVLPTVNEQRVASVPAVAADDGERADIAHRVGEEPREKRGDDEDAEDLEGKGLADTVEGGAHGASPILPGRPVQ